MLKISPEAARAVVKRHRLPRSRSNHRKTLVQVDLAEISHSPLSRGPPRMELPSAIATKSFEKSPGDAGAFLRYITGQ